MHSLVVLYRHHWPFSRQIFSGDRPSGEEREGPFSTPEVKALIRQKRINIGNTLAFRKGSKTWKYLYQIPELVPRRAGQLPGRPEDLPEVSEGNVWYVRSRGMTFGPVSLLQVSEALKKGSLQHTDFIWKQGMKEWQYIYELQEFERRSPDRAISRNHSVAP